jgi:copper chaperone
MKISTRALRFKYCAGNSVIEHVELHRQLQIILMKLDGLLEIVPLDVHRVHEILLCCCGCIIGGMETVELKVEGMDCQGCVKSVTRMLSGIAGVDKVDVSLEEGRARVTYDPAKAGRAEFKRAIERAGYKAP